LNFLAHIFLSGKDPEIMIGNFIADYVKGNKKNLYPERIRKGIELHRGIDDFTDHHPLTAISKERLRPKYGKYAGVIVDIYYDHFLASHFSDYSSMNLRSYSENTYRILKEHWDILPEGVQYFLPFMIERNWLLNYATLEGTGRTLTGLSRRVSFENKMDEAVYDLKRMYTDFENDFLGFFPELRKFAEDKLP